MNKVLLVAQREISYNIRRGAYIFAAFVIPLFVLASFVLIIAIFSDDENLEGYDTVGFVDANDLLVEDEDFARFQAYPDEEAVETAFDLGEIDAYFVLGEDYLTTGEATFTGNEDLPIPLEEDFSDFIRESILVQFPEGAPLERLENTTSGNYQIRTLDGESISRDALVARFLQPIIFMILYLSTVLTSSQFLMTGVVEEKENRIMEILVTSLRPGQLLIGKIIGLGSLALLQIAVWVTVGLSVAALTGQLDVLQEISPDVGLILVTLLYYALAYALFASIMIGVGASVSAEQESRQLASIFVIISVIPLYALAILIENPDGGVAIALGLFPLTAPLTMLALVGLGAAPTWLIVGSIVSLIVAIIVAIWASVRIFRVGMLMTGQRLSMRQIRLALLGG